MSLYRRTRFLRGSVIIISLHTADGDYENRLDRSIDGALVIPVKPKIASRRHSDKYFIIGSVRSESGRTDNEPGPRPLVVGFSRFCVDRARTSASVKDGAAYFSSQFFLHFLSTCRPAPESDNRNIIIIIIISVRVYAVAAGHIVQNVLGPR